MNITTFVGLDVHKETITVAATDHSGIVRDIGTIKNERPAILKMVKKLGNPESLYFCYEAGPCGYGVHRQLTNMGAKCVVVAPSLIPRAPGERVKTDRKDAQKLAKMLMWGQLQPVWVPDEEHEAFRQLVRAREYAQEDVTCKKNQIGKLLMYCGVTPPVGVNPWSSTFREWLPKVRFDFDFQNIMFSEYLHALNEAESRVKRLEALIAEASLNSKLARVIAGLQCLRGVSLITAATVVAEAGDITRFTSPAKLMAYAGLVPSEHSSGKSISRGRITKTGNNHLRRVVVEAAWHYRHIPRVGETLKKRQQGVPEEVKQIAWKAQQRLNYKIRKSLARGKNKNVVTVATARELLGFMWAIAMQIQPSPLTSA